MLAPGLPAKTNSVYVETWLMLELQNMGMACAICIYNDHTLQHQQLHVLLHAALRWQR